MQEQYRIVSTVEWYYLGRYTCKWYVCLWIPRNGAMLEIALVWVCVVVFSIFCLLSFICF